MGAFASFFVVFHMNFTIAFPEKVDLVKPDFASFNAALGEVWNNVQSLVLVIKVIS